MDLSLAAVGVGDFAHDGHSGVRLDGCELPAQGCNPVASVFGLGAVFGVVAEQLVAGLRTPLAGRRSENGGNVIGYRGGWLSGIGYQDSETTDRMVGVGLLKT